MKMKFGKNIILLTNLIILVIVQAALLNLSGLDITYSFVDSIISGFLYGIISIGIYNYLKYLELNNIKLFIIIINHLIAGLLLSYIWIEAVKVIIPFIWDMSAAQKSFFDETYSLRFILGVLYFVIIISISYIVKTINEINKQKLIEAKLKVNIKESELNKLKYQINPHFIFNSLNSISSLIISSPERAQEMTIMLSDFFRNMLKVNNKKFTDLNEELENIVLYLDIEKVRFQDKLEIRLDIKDSDNIKVPSLILQPLIENAIKHAVYNALGKIKVEIKGEKCPGYYKIIISNNFEDGHDFPKKGTGFGLEYVRNRLSLIYNNNDLLKYYIKDNYFIVEIIFPD